jgi:uncharacterized membrane protein
MRLSLRSRVDMLFPLLFGPAALLLGCSNGPASPPAGGGADATFEGVGDLPGGVTHSEVLAVSDDGRVVVGRSSSANFDDEGFVLAQGDTMRALLGPGGVPVASEPRALVADGSVVAGKLAPAGGSPEAARWTLATGWVGLGDLPGGDTFSQALGISADGVTLVGWGSSDLGFESVRWVAGVAAAMGDLPGGAFQGAAAAASGDGAVIVGTGTSAEGAQAYRWTAATGMLPLGDLAGGAFESEPFAMTPDATVIVGEGASGNGVEAFRWTAAGGFVGLGDLDGGAFESRAFDVTADGRTVVGMGKTAAGSEAFVWDASRGMRRLEDVLLAAGADGVAGWTLTEATGVSADGKTIVGNGTNPRGESEGWVARLP